MFRGCNIIRADVPWNDQIPEQEWCQNGRSHRRQLTVDVQPADPESDVLVFVLGSYATAPPHSPNRDPKGRTPSSKSGEHGQARRVPHAPSLLCHGPHPRWVRHPNGAGAARPQEREDDHDLHARAEPGRPGRAKPSGPTPRRLVFFFTALCERARPHMLPPRRRPLT